MRGGLAGLGVGRGDRVALLCGNGLFFVDAYLAVARPRRGRPCRSTRTSPAPEIARELATVGATVVVVDPVAAPAWSAIDRAAVPSVEHVIATEPAGADAAGADVRRAPRRRPGRRVDVDADDLAVLMFTSGTAGEPRAAMLSHGNLLGQPRARAARTPATLSPRRRRLRRAAAVPHLRPQRRARLRRCAAAPPSCSCSASTRRPRSTRSATAASRSSPARRRCGWPSATSTTPRPTASPPCAWRSPARRGMPEEAIRRLQRRFGVRARRGLRAHRGLAGRHQLGRLRTIRPGSVGKVLDGVEVRLVDETGDDVLAGDAGEIWVQGPERVPGLPRRPGADGHGC